MDRATRIVVRVIRSPIDARGQVVVVLAESRCVHDRDVVAYAVTSELFFVEDLRRLMDRTRAANPHEAADARQAYQYVCHEPVKLSHMAVARGVRRRTRYVDDPDELPADDDTEL